MAERPNQNWGSRFVESLGANFRYDVNNPQMGCGGADVYRFYGVTDDNSKTSIGLDQGGTLKLNSDRSIEISAGAKNSRGGEDIVIASLAGNISITADKTGTIKIRGSHIRISSDGDLDISAGNDMNFSANNIVFNANSMDTEAQTGNMIPFSKTWMAKVYSGSYVGADIVAQFLGRFIGAS